MIKYQVWFLGYDKNDCVTDFEQLVGEFKTGKEALDCAKDLDITDIDLFKDNTTTKVCSVVEKVRVFPEGDEEAIDTTIIETFKEE